MPEVLQIAGSLGVGAFLGLVIFLMYRIDVKASLEEMKNHRKSTETMLITLITAEIKAREENTRVLSELVTLLERLNGRLK